MCLYLRHEWCGRVMLLISMFGGGGLRVLAGDPGGQGGGQLAGHCGPLLRWRWERESAVRRETELASPAWSLGHTLYLFGNQGGWRWALEGTVSLSPNARDPHDCDLRQPVPK